MRSSDELSIGQIAERSGLAVSALRHYDAQGLIQADRDAAGRRVFPRAVLRRLAFIRAAQAVGVSLTDIGDALSGLPANRVPTAADWRKLSAQWERRLDERIEALTALKTKLTSCIGCGCLSLRTCALTNPQDVSGAFTSGAGYLPRLLRGG